MLKKFKQAIGLNIEDIIKIPLVIFSLKIQLMSDHKPNIEHHRRLNLPIQEDVKKDNI